MIVEKRQMFRENGSRMFEIVIIYLIGLRLYCQPISGWRFIAIAQKEEKKNMAHYLRAASIEF